MSTAKVNIFKTYLNIHVFVILMVLFNMYEVILIWTQTDIHQQFSNEQLYIGWAFYIHSSQHYITLFSKALPMFRNKLKNNSYECLYGT